MTAQAMRAALLASATAAILAGRRASSPRTQASRAAWAAPNDLELRVAGGYLFPGNPELQVGSSPYKSEQCLLSRIDARLGPSMRRLANEPPQRSNHHAPPERAGTVN